VGIHAEQDFFGLARLDAGDVGTPDQMERTIAQTHIVKRSSRARGPLPSRICCRKEGLPEYEAVDSGSEGQIGMYLLVAYR
jgi:hypothetical protein